MKKIFLTLFASILVLSMFLTPTTNETAYAESYDESEPNDDTYDANQLELGNDVKMFGTFDKYQSDYYKITVHNKGKLEIVFNTVNTSASDAFLLLLAENEETQDTVNEYNGKQQIKYTYNVSSGDYYLQVDDMSKVPTFGQYVIQAYMTKDTTPPKNLKVNKVTDSTTSITGTTEAKASVEVKLGSKLLGKGKADSNGNFRMKIKTQKKGTKLTVIAKDEAGNAKKISVTVVLTPRQYAYRNTYWGDSMKQVKKVIKSKLIGSDSGWLLYKTSTFGYESETHYFFKKNKLDSVMVQIKLKDGYYTLGDMRKIHDFLYPKLKKELNTTSKGFTNDDGTSTQWYLKSRDVFLSVYDNSYYETRIGIMYSPLKK